MLCVNLVVLRKLCEKLRCFQFTQLSNFTRPSVVTVATNINSVFNAYVNYNVLVTFHSHWHSMTMLTKHIFISYLVFVFVFVFVLFFNWSVCLCLKIQYADGRAQMPEAKLVTSLELCPTRATPPRLHKG